MTKTDAAAAVLAGLAVATAVSAGRAARGVGTPSPEAVAFHGAHQLYRNLALFFGKRALLAEASYWKAINQ